VVRTVNVEQHARKRRRILDAAAEEFAAHGIDGTSTAAICRRAGIGSGTLFHYFATKRDIFHALFRDDLERNAEACERALAASAPTAGLEVLLDHLTGDLDHPLVPGLMAAAIHQATRDEEFAQLIVADEHLIRRTLTTLLTTLARERRRLVFPPGRAARWIQRLLDASYLAARDDGFDPELHTAELYRIVAWLTGQPVEPLIPP
jgi:AcrR family transcriptional regulator